MAHMIIRQRVQELGKWKAAHKVHQQIRKTAGLKGIHVWHNIEDPNEIFLLFEGVDVAKAKTFATSVDLKEKMTKAGVIGPPEIFFLSA
jgi:hypothetical protein